MLDGLMALSGVAEAASLEGFFSSTRNYLLIFLGFSLIIFVHELGHFLAAKWCDVRVEKFAIGFGKEIFGFKWGETRYALNILPLGGYVKMLGQEDFEVDKSGEMRVKEDPRAFSHKPVGQRMVIVSAGVVFNVLFAALIFMIIFMVGMEKPSSVIGFVYPESPCDQAGLLKGDRIISIDGQKVADFDDAMPAIVLSNPDKPLTVVVERPDPAGGPPTQETFKIIADATTRSNPLMLGFMPTTNNVVTSFIRDPAIKESERLQLLDRIQAIDGQPVESLFEIMVALMKTKGRWATLEVERPAAEAGGEPITLELPRRSHLTFIASSDSPLMESGHLLGLAPLRVVTALSPGSPAEQAGIEPDDVLFRVGKQTAPTLQEILEIIRSNPNTELDITVLRRVKEGSPDGAREPIQLTVVPRQKGWLWMKEATPKVGMDVFQQQYNEQLLVADIVTELVDGATNPAAVLKDVMPRGSLITKVNDRPVTTWGELTDAFVELAGTDVKLTWSYQGGPEESGTIHVPATLGTTFDLPPDHKITKIAGVTNVEIMEEGKPTSVSVSNWKGARAVLKDQVGKTVAVEHRSVLAGEPVVEQVSVSEEMLDTWRLRYVYQPDIRETQVVQTLVRETNPFKAMMIGLRKTYYFIEQVYVVLERMVFSRTVGFEEISGPVGIVKIGSEMAERDFVKLLYFLAIMSANLAVINFLPLPIVDGGLFVFLIIEKIKGSPISLKVQMATQMIGLALIIGVFVAVTIQDVSKLFN